MKIGDNIYLCFDGKYEEGYIKVRDKSEKVIYGCCYGRTMEEAKGKKDYQLQKQQKQRK